MRRNAEHCEIKGGTYDMIWTVEFGNIKLGHEMRRKRLDVHDPYTRDKQVLI